MYGVSPNLTEAHHLGHNSYKWKSINQKINFSGDAIGIGTESPSGTIGLVTVQGNVLPKSANVYALGSEDLKWDGFFNDIVVSAGLLRPHSETLLSFFYCQFCLNEQQSNIISGRKESEYLSSICLSPSKPLFAFL